MWVRKKPGNVMCPANHRMKFSLFLFCEFFFADSANGADPIFGQIFEGGSRCNSVIGVANGWVINVAASFAFVFGHDFLLAL